MVKFFYRVIPNHFFMGFAPDYKFKVNFGRYGVSINYKGTAYCFTTRTVQF